MENEYKSKKLNGISNAALQMYKNMIFIDFDMAIQKIANDHKIEQHDVIKIISELFIQ